MKQVIQFSLPLLMLFTTGAIAQQPATVAPLSGEARDRHIQKAIAWRTQENYRAAAAQLDSVLTHHPADAPLLLFKGDVLLQAKSYRKAAETYTQLLPLNFESTVTQINLSYALFMHHQPVKALHYAKKAWQQNNTNSNAVVNYFNALLWNIQTKKAAVFLQQQEALLSPAQKLVLSARLFTTRGDYTQGLKYYDSLVKKFPDKYYVQEYAEVLLGKKQLAASKALMQGAKNLFTDKEYQTYVQQLQSTIRQNAGTEMVYFKDIAQNTRIENSIWWQQNENRNYRIRISAGHSSIRSASNDKTHIQFAHVQVQEKWRLDWSGETDVHLQRVNPATGGGFTAITGQQTIKYQPNDRRMFGVQYHTDILNFTAALLGKNIRTHQLGYLTHLMLSGKTGFYSQGSAGLLSDKNRRYQLFGSLYHLFRTEPTLKAGINFSVLSFSDRSIKNYFSPGRYMHTELFTDYSTAMASSGKFYLQVQAAAGMQKIGYSNPEPSFRIQTELGIRLRQVKAALKYQRSDVASNTGTGYQFDWFAANVSITW